MITQGQAVLHYGTVNETWGYADNLNVKDTADKQQLKDGQGDTKSVIYSDIRKEVSGEYTPLSGAADPITKADIVGSVLTVKTEGVNSIDVVIDDAEIAYKKGDVSVWKFNGHYYPNVTVS